MNMTTMKWLLKREMWEHKGGFFWAPLVIASLLSIVIVLTSATLATRGVVSFESSVDGVVKTEKMIVRLLVMIKIF